MNDMKKPQTLPDEMASGSVAQDHPLLSPEPPIASLLVREATCPATILPDKVSLKGKMTPSGYKPENHEWIDVLTEVVGGKRCGKNPLAIPCEVLTAAGHGPRRTNQIISAMGDIKIQPDIIRYTQLRQHCLQCAENAAEVRRCAVINCPMWPYRTGSNPHNPKRGTNPFQRANGSK